MRVVVLEHGVRFFHKHFNFVDVLFLYGRGSINLHQIGVGVASGLGMCFPDCGRRVRAMFWYFARAFSQAALARFFAAEAESSLSPIGFCCSRSGRQLCTLFLRELVDEVLW